MASKEFSSVPSQNTLHLQHNELKIIKSDVDRLKNELINAQTKYEQRLADYEAKLEFIYQQTEQMRQEHDEKETNLLNETLEWLDVKSKLAQSAVSSKQKVILNVGGEYFETTIETLTKYNEESMTYFTVLFSRQWQLEKDPKDESLFIDRDAHLFSYILQYFRTGQLSIDTDNILLRRDLIAEAEFYKINSLVRLLEINDNIQSKAKPLMQNAGILSLSEQSQLKQWFGNQDQQWKLLYRASRDGYTAQSFHQRCDGKSPTITVIRSQNGCIFGGFTSTPWSSTKGDKTDSSACLFTLKNPHQIPPTKYPIHPQVTRFAVSHKPNHGPSFGLGADGRNDIFLHSPFNVSGCRIFFPQVYIDTTGGGQYTFTGSPNFHCEDIEVFILS